MCLRQYQLRQERYTVDYQQLGNSFPYNHFLIMTILLDPSPPSPPLPLPFNHQPSQSSIHSPCQVSSVSTTELIYSQAFGVDGICEIEFLLCLALEIFVAFDSEVT
jgi:hypothetical protein